MTEAKRPTEQRYPARIWTTAADPEPFESFSEAYAACRERDRPVLVQVEDTIGTVYPSGYYRPSKRKVGGK